MKITVLPNTGFCFGVLNSINLSKNELHTANKPLYLLGMLVHNDIVNSEFIKAGYIQIKNETDIDLILNNTKGGTFISTAHGISSKLKDKILKKGFRLIDTTCPIVKANNEKIIHYYNEGFSIIYIGKHNHSESDVIKKYVDIVETPRDVDNLNIKNERIVITNQTTMSEKDFNVLLPLILKKYPKALNDLKICPATLERQQDLIYYLEKYHNNNDIWLIVGDPKSNNTKKLLEIVTSKSNNYYLISNLSDLQMINYNDNSHILITSGTSTPNGLINDIVMHLNKK